MTQAAEETPEELPDLATLKPWQLYGSHCALCARRLGMDARELGPEQALRGYPVQLWACDPTCEAP